jgi:hypothetical protein
MSELSNQEPAAGIEMLVQVGHRDNRKPLGYGQMYELPITHITPDVHPEQQVEVILNDLHRN